MKKILFIVFVSTVILGTNIFAQNGDYDYLVKKIEKSNANLQNPQKTQNYKYWAQRAKLFMDAYSINSKYLSVGMNVSMLNLVGITESSPTPYYGKPISKQTEGDYEVWVYPRVKIYVKNNAVDHWVDTKPIDTLALEKAYEAYKKAIELDKKGKFVDKKSTKQELFELRNDLINKAADQYSNKNYKEATDLIGKALDLFQYPRLETDSTNIGTIYYYAGIFAYNAKQPDKAKEYFLKSIENNYEIGSCYQYVAQLYYEAKDSTAALKFLEDGATKYPQETKIIYSLIDYYTPRGEYDKAFKYIDKAIQMTPDLAVLYIVKANSYQKIFEGLQAKFFKLLKEADSLDQLAFRVRSNQTKHDEVIAEENDILNNKVPPAEKKMNEYFNNAVNAYKQGIEKEQNADYYYALSYMYYKTGVLNTVTSSNLRKLKKYIALLNDKSAKFFEQAKIYGEKAYQLNPKDTYTVDLLSKIYYRLKMYDKSTEMKKKYNELKAQSTSTTE